VKRYLTLLVAVAALAEEPSAFEAGNLNASKPYGLTPQEQAIWQNKQDIKELKTKLYTLQSDVQTIKERIAGIESLVEGIDQSLNRLRRSEANQSVASSDDIAALRQDLNASVALQKENYAKIRRILRELTKMVDHINATYVSRKELKSELAKIYALIDKKRTMSEPTSKIYAKAREAYKKRDYAKARELYEAAIAKNYKPATSHFYAGESCYYSKQYDCAVEHYKKSATLYANSAFMPTLLLHTAISLEKLGKKKEAKSFYDNLIKLYPDSKAAAIAKSRVKK